MEIVMKKKKTFCPRKEHLAMIAAAVGIGMALAFWCLVWPVTGARAGPWRHWLWEQPLPMP